MTKLIYGVDRATEWARAYAPALLVLDKAAFEALAKSPAADAMNVPAEVLREPKVYIDRDLVEAVEVAA